MEASQEPRPPSVLDELVAELFTVFRPRGPATERLGSTLTMGQLHVLFRLRHDGPQTMGAIARVASCSLQAATALVGRIERQGLVTREHREDDRRIVEVRLSDHGQRLLDELAGHREQRMRDVLGHLDPHEQAEMLRLIRLITERQRRPDREPASTRGDVDR